MATINVSGPIRPLDAEYPILIAVGIPIVKDGRVIGHITKVDTANNMWYGTVEEDVEMIFPDACGMTIINEKEKK